MPLKLSVHGPLFSVTQNLIKSFGLDLPYGQRRQELRGKTSADAR